VSKQRHAARQARLAQDERAAEQERAVRQEEERAAEQHARLEEERATQERERAAQQQRERTAAQERAAEQHARLEEERVRLEEERATQERERAAQQERERTAAQERAHQVQESLARQELKRAAKQERAARRERAAEQKRAARQERERAAQELIEQERAAEERARQEQERAAEELARQLEELAAKERIRQEQEREDREWAAQRRARLEREREEAEELANREQGKAEQNGAAQLPPRQLAAAGLTRAHPPAQPQPRVPETQGSWRHRTSALIAAAVVLMGAGSLAVARSLHGSGSSGRANIGTPTQNQAAAWVAGQVDPSAVMTCDPAMCLVLKAHGVPTYDLSALEPKTRNPFGNSQIVVATADIRDEIGSRLTSVYAPAMLASFGSGKAQIDIRVIAPDGAAAYLRDLKVDQQERKQNGAAFLAIGTVTTSATAREQLAAGEVDSRLMFLFSFMTTSISHVDIVGFGDSGPGADTEIPLRSATLTGSTASLKSIMAFVHGQSPLYRPSHAKLMQRDGKPTLVIEFSAPSPLLLGHN
jgi:hypothetical protein